MNRKFEKAIELSLLATTLVTVLTTVLIIVVLTYETVIFFSQVSIVEFFTNTEWTPLFDIKNYGILPLLAGTLLTTVVAIALALPVGLTIAIYLSEYSNKRFRRMIKPTLELLAAVPTVVYGFFALVIVTPVLQSFIPGLSGFNSLSAGLVMGIMIVPYVSSLSEDALYAVPRSLHEASYAMGASRLQTMLRVVLPAASSGVIVAVILAISRAVGETMIVAIAAGQQPRFTANPLVPVETITAYIVQVSLGDVPHNSIEYRTIYAAGITLFGFTFLLNNISYWLRKRLREQYD